MINARRFMAIAGVIILSLCIFTSCARKESEKEYMDSGAYESEGNQILINPFTDLSVSFDGISPFCTISYNNAKCSMHVQENISYSLFADKVDNSTFFAIGDRVKVYAIDRNASQVQESEYNFMPLEKEFTVSDVPYYLLEITNEDDLTEFKSYAKDYLDSITAWKQADYHPFGTPRGYFVSSDKLTLHQVHFSSLKYNEYSNIDSLDYFNRIDMLYSVEICNTEFESYTHPFDPIPGNYYTVYFSIYAENIIKNKQGKIEWQTEGRDLINDFKHNIINTSLNDLINENIVSRKDKYNTVEISEIFGL